ncbi:TNT domain-containing protein [Xenorhabdus griffiniae]|uniref:TNT domain-containing protein n=1 Tax=Xenorhabdus griffiniae TaxID=351672 RepID=UPI00167429FD|nr:TNT domain-containing protein [Xenorhabdus griffiniae]MBE8587305.1 TNT domain-containing protein [Xenorhabdus griffiniae]
MRHVSHGVITFGFGGLIYRAVFVVKKPITVDAGEITPWFGYPGRGIQYDLPKKVNELIADGSLEKISVTGKPIPF